MSEGIKKYLKCLSDFDMSSCGKAKWLTFVAVWQVLKTRESYFRRLNDAKL